MLTKIQSYIKNLFNPEKNEQEAQEQKTAELQNKANTVFGTTSNNTNNPFLNKNGELFNPFLNYQKLLDNPSISQRAKNYITQATGLTPKTTTVTPTTLTGQNGNTVTPTQTFLSSTQSGGTSDNSIANAAQKYIGTPYVWGGESMAEGGMDCSGFVYNALKDAGYDVGRTTAQGYRNYGTSVSKADMQPGDLIFFGKNNNDASHIGIYIGNGQMIHSSGGSKNTKSNPGKGVSITNVDYRNDFLEARRY